MTKPIKWAAELHDVLDITLQGTCPANVFRSQLLEAGLDVGADDLDVRIVAASSRFKGIPFQELSLSISADREEYLMLHGLTSNRFFAFIERKIFSTPYSYGSTRMEAETALSVQSERAGQNILRAIGAQLPSMGAEPHIWQAMVRMPGGKKAFKVHIEGNVAERPVSVEDQIQIGSGWPHLAALREAGFRPETWFLRRDATHRKSKTIRLP